MQSSTAIFLLLLTISSIHSYKISKKSKDIGIETEIQAETKNDISITKISESPKISADDEKHGTGLQLKLPKWVLNWGLSKVTDLNTYLEKGADIQNLESNLFDSKNSFSLTELKASGAIKAADLEKFTLNPDNNQIAFLIDADLKESAKVNKKASDLTTTNLKDTEDGTMKMSLPVNADLKLAISTTPSSTSPQSMSPQVDLTGSNIF